MEKIKFSIPYNGDLQLMEEAVMSGQVYEIYFAGSKKYNFSDPYVDWNHHSENKIYQLLDFCCRKNIQANFLINKATLFFEDIKKIEKYVKRLRSTGVHLHLTVADLCIVSFLKDKFPKIKLQSSIYMGIENAFKAEQALRAGISELCLAASLNRDFKELKKIMALKKKWPGLTIKLLGIHNCYLWCPYLSRHSELPIFNETLATTYLSDNEKLLGRRVNYETCFYRVESVSDEIKRPIIRPEDISYYETNKLADYIKIAFRNETSRVLRDKFNAYFNRSFEGNLFCFINSNKHKKLFCNNKRIPKDFIKKVMTCSKNCVKCGYCDELAKALVRVEE